MKKNLLGLLTTLLIAGMLSGCGGKTQAPAETEAKETLVIETAAETETEIETEAEEEGELAEGQMYSYLTGEPIDEAIGLRRPYAIMTNNIQAALPQSGVIYADIIYECQVEGGITRLMTLFQDCDDIEKIGTIRSARHYYIDLANDHDAVYVHFGQSRFALDRIEKEGLTTIHGLSGYEAKVFYRSTDRVAPHNVYTTGEMLEKGLEITGLTRDYSEDYKPGLVFHKSDKDLDNGEIAETINIPFDSKPYFTYNTEDGLYYRWQYGEKHIDRETDKQLAFKNIIIQYVKEQTISSEDHQDLELIGKGTGLYITNGKCIAINWEKQTVTDQTRYYDENGKQIKLNPGKTFFEMVPNTRSVTFE